MSDHDMGGSSIGDAVENNGCNGGLIDVSGLTFEELSAQVSAADLRQALDRILASGQNGNGYHGFNSQI
jgi:hypothetical protein